jgi:hypothetical protein
MNTYRFGLLLGEETLPILSLPSVSHGLYFAVFMRRVVLTCRYSTAKPVPGTIARSTINLVSGTSRVSRPFS